MSIVESMLKATMQNLRAGRRDQAAELCRDICRMEPEHARAHSLLGMIEFQNGDTDRALDLLARAQQLNPNLPDVPRALAEIYLGMDDLEKALEAQRRAISLNPRDAMGHLQAAVVLQRLGRHDEAEAETREALNRNPAMTGAHQLLGTITYLDGRLTEAVDAMSTARASERPVADPNHTLALALLATGRADEIGNLSPAVTANQTFGETIIRAISAWVDDRPDQCRELLASARPLIPSMPVEAPNRSVFITYLNILDELVSWRMDNEESYRGETDRTLHVIGDSHTLSSANLVLPVDGVPTRLRSHLVFGCKAWHLIREAPSPYRGGFDLALARIPDGATVVAVFGELDCRLKEGMVRALRKDPNLDRDALVDDLVERYVDFMLSEGAKRGHTVWFQSPPMSNVNMSLVEGEIRDLFLYVIKRFNDRLRMVTQERGARLIDINSVTTADDGSAARGHYIDTNHIRPSALIEAFAVADS